MFIYLTGDLGCHRFLTAYQSRYTDMQQISLTSQLAVIQFHRPLCECKDSHEGQLRLSRYTFKNLVKLRIGKFPTHENSTRGIDVDKKWHHCMRVNESTKHAIQDCHFMHFPRI